MQRTVKAVLLLAVSVLIDLPTQAQERATPEIFTIPQLDQAIHLGIATGPFYP